MILSQSKINHFIGKCAAFSVCLFAAVCLSRNASCQINPVEIGHVNEFPGYSVQYSGFEDHDVTISGHNLIVANVAGTFIYDVSNPSQPQRLTSALPGGAMSQTTSGALLFQADATSGWRIFSISNVANPVSLSFTNLPGGNVAQIAASGNYAYLSDQNNGLCIYDVSDPAHPALLSQTNTSSSDQGVALSGHYAYVTTFVDGLHVFDVSNPSLPVQIARVDTGGTSLSGYNMSIRGNYLYLADGWDGLRIFDISNPANPTSVGHLEIGQYAQHIEVAGNYAYVVEYYTGLRICDISNPTNPILLPSTNNNYGAYSYSLTVSSNDVYLANGGDGLRVYSFSMPASPHLSMSRGAGTVLSWPAPTAAFVLQQSPSLAGKNWTTITNVPTVIGNQNQVALPVQPGTNFYRLKFPDS